MAKDNILELKNITKEFSGVTVLHGIDLAVERGTIHALVGENGAGKSTLMKILSGFYPYGEFTGTISLEGKETRFNSIKEAEQNGIEIIMQELELVRQLPAFENIFLGSEITQRGLLNKRQMIVKAFEIFERFDLNIDPTAVVENLGIGQQQMVVIAKALSKDAKILIFDEPTAALTETEARKLFKIMGELKNKGVTLIYISHRLNEVMSLADKITVLRDGSTVITDLKSNFTEDTLIKYMVGREIENRFPKRESQIGEVVLKVSGMTAVNELGMRVVNNVSFETRAGEVVGISGLMGAGRTELVSAIYGAFNGSSSGSIEINGKKTDIRSPREAIKNGIGLVVEDRKSEGLVTCLDVINNISMASLKDIVQHGVLNKHREAVRVNDMVEKLSVRAPRLTIAVERLSGGNQQKVSVAKMLMTNPKVLILDEPTRGIDVGAKYEIYLIINQLAEMGVSILMISSELPEVLGMSDRILVMKNGRITAELEKESATQERVMYYATLGEENG